MSLNPWLAMLDSEKLSKAEKAICDKFQKEPTGRGFLQVADLLRTYGLISESLELLADGVARHPNYSAARVVLVRDLLDNGMVAEAWENLEASPSSLSKNVMAQKLRLKISVLIGKGSVASATLEHMKSHQMLESGMKRVANLLESEGVVAAKSIVIEEYRQKGVELTIPAVDVDEFPISDHDDESNTQDDMPALGVVDSGQSIDGFRVHSLKDLFSSNAPAADFIENVGVELDSTTLADIYCKQGHYGKALGIYKRLLKLSPSNDYLKQKVVEMTKLNRDQKDDDRELDPVAVERLETLEIIDIQIDYLQSLYDRIK